MGFGLPLCRDDRLQTKKVKAAGASVNLSVRVADHGFER